MDSTRRASVLAKVHARRVSRRAVVSGAGGGMLAGLMAALARRPSVILAQAGTPEGSPAGGALYGVLRRYQLAPGASMDELIARVRAGYVPIIRQVPGFVSYIWILDPASSGHVAIAIFRDKAGADESTRRAADWVRANVATMVKGPTEVIEGAVPILETAGGAAATPAAP